MRLDEPKARIIALALLRTDVSEGYRKEYSLALRRVAAELTRYRAVPGMFIRVVDCLHRMLDQGAVRLALKGFVR